MTKDPYTFKFLDTDTITVVNASGTSLTFSIPPDIPLAMHDSIITTVQRSAWSRILELAVYENAGTLSSRDENRLLNNAIDGHFGPDTVERDYGVAWPEFDRMYKFAKLQLITALEERMSALSKK